MGKGREVVPLFQSLIELRGSDYHGHSLRFPKRTEMLICISNGIAFMRGLKPFLGRFNEALFCFGRSCLRAL
jgi:hypothetical protein